MEDLAKKHGIKPGDKAKEKPCKFFVGQNVRDYVLFPDCGVGTIEEIHRSAIIVRFGDNDKYYYKDGNYDSSFIPTLVPADQGFSIDIPAPEPEFERGERVLARDFKYRRWVGLLYGGPYIGGGKPCGGGGAYYTMRDINGNPWVYCRKWDESLIGKVTE